MTDSPLDRAHAAMDAAPADEGARLAWYQAFAGTDLSVLLEREPQDGNLSPRLFPLEEGLFLAAFDGEERLAAFAGAPLPYAALPGRVIVSLLAGQDVGIAVNPGDAARAFLMPPEAVDWLARLLAEAPQATDVRPDGWEPAHAPGLATLLSGRLQGFGALAACGWLARGRFAGGREVLLLILQDAAPEARPALAKAAGEALAFAGMEADVVFMTGAEAAALDLPRLADPIPLPRPAPPPGRAVPAAPGSDPDRPPRLR